MGWESEIGVALVMSRLKAKERKKEVRPVAKMYLVPTRKTYQGEGLVDVYDAQRLNARGEIYLVAKGIPERAAKLEWEEYIKRYEYHKERGLS